ncbi:MAG: recombinase family protein [Janthinobacterium lividum]
MRVAIYARVSTKDKGQDLENQLYQLRAFAERPGTIYQVFTDRESGGKADSTELASVKRLVQKFSESPPNAVPVRSTIIIITS